MGLVVSHLREKRLITTTIAETYISHNFLKGYLQKHHTLKSLSKLNGLDNWIISFLKARIMLFFFFFLSPAQYIMQSSVHEMMFVCQNEDSALTGQQLCYNTGEYLPKQIFAHPAPCIKCGCGTVTGNLQIPYFQEPTGVQAERPSRRGQHLSSSRSTPSTKENGVKTLARSVCVLKDG